MVSITKSIMSMDQFNLVKFVDVHESYCYLNDLDCSFTITEAATPDSNDVIGIFAVGWKSITDYFCSMPVVLPADYKYGSCVECKIKFEATRLPQDESEFYQFCYISHSDRRIRGVSSPFQLVADRSATGWEIVDIENNTSLAPSLLPVEEELSTTDASIVTIEQPPHSELNVQRGAHDSFKENESLLSQIDDLKQQLQNKQKELDAVYKENELFKTESASAASILESALNEIKQRYNDVSATVEQLKQSLLHKEAEVALKEEAIKTLENQLNEARAVCDKRHTEFSMLTADLQTHEDKRKEIEADAAAKIETLNLTLQQKEDEWIVKAETFQAQVEELRTLLNAERAKTADLERQITKATGKHAVGGEAAAGVTAAAEITENVDTNAAGAGAAAAAGDGAAQGPEERFPDDFEAKLHCPICNMEFPTDWVMQLAYDHVLAHVERLCPVCDRRFAPDTPEHELVKHVEQCLQKSFKNA